MRIAILGVGSIGGLILGTLSDTSAELVAVSRGKTFCDLSDMGLILNTPEGSIELIPSDRFILIDSNKIIPEKARKSYVGASWRWIDLPGAFYSMGRSRCVPAHKSF